MAQESEPRPRIEEIKVTGEAVVARVKELIHEGKIRRIIIKTEDGRTLVEIPLTVGIAGGVLTAFLAPLLAAIAAIGALVARLSIIVERRG